MKQKRRGKEKKDPGFMDHEYRLKAFSIKHNKICITGVPEEERERWQKVYLSKL